jgi:hypothetical protein
LCCLLAPQAQQQQLLLRSTDQLHLLLTFICRVMVLRVTSTTGTTLVGRASISTDTASTFGNLSIYIPNYAGSADKNFSVDTVSENNATTAYTQIFTGVWANTAAITQITLSLANFAQYSNAYLYGILKGSGGATVS